MKNIFTIALSVSLFFIVIIYWVELTLKNPISILMIPLIVSLFNFTITPIFKYTRIYKYITPLLLAYNPTFKVYELHNGTSYDYLLNIKRFKKKGIKRVILIDHLKGLLLIINEIELNNLPSSIIIKGTSYFFSKRTAIRFGFIIEKTSINEKLNFYMNYFDLLWMNSLANKQLAFPNLRNLKTIKIEGSELVKSKSMIKKFLIRIEN